MNGAAGILAIWNDRDEAIAPVYEHWYVHEHVPERLAVPGFLAARRYERVDGGSPRFFTSYGLTGVDVLASAAYLERLAAPSELTRRVMAHLRNMVRTACVPVRHSPARRLGGWAAVVWVPQPATVGDALLALADECAADGRVLNVQVWRAASDPGPASTEATLRPGGDARVEAAMVVEVMREAEAQELAMTVGAALAAAVRAPVCAGAYQLLARWGQPP